MKATPSDRRKRLRVPIRAKIKHSLYQVLGTPVFEENSSVDFSSNGISFGTAREYKKGALILIEVGLKSDSIRLLVCVAWVKPVQSGFQVGAEWVAIDPVQKRMMQKHLQELIEKLNSKAALPKKKKTQSRKIKKAAPRRQRDA